MSKLICFYEFITLNTQKIIGDLQMATEKSQRLLVTDEIISKADKKLDSLFTEKKTTATAAVQKLKTKILGLRRKGVSVREIADALRSCGLDVSDSLVSLTCGPLQKRQKTEKVVDNKVKNQAASTNRVVETKLVNKPIDFKRDSTVTVQTQKTKLVGNATYDPAASLKI